MLQDVNMAAGGIIQLLQKSEDMILKVVVNLDTEDRS
jgi:hypothetical protein